MTEPVLVAQITDTHVVDPDAEVELFVDNNGRLDEIVAAILEEVPPIDVVLATGDLTNDGDVTAYEILGSSLAPLGDRLLPIPGNHDHRDRFRSTFLDVPWVDAQHLSWSVVRSGVRLVGLDTVRPGEHGAECDPDRADWLASALAAPFDGPTILAMHHPPFDTGIWQMDKNGFLGLDLLEDAVRSAPPDVIVCGHLHRPASSTFAGVPARIGLSTVQHVALDLRSPDDVGPISVIRDPVGFQIHRVATDDAGRRSIVSHVRHVGTGEQAIVPEWARTD